jgi:hypothetical protein
MKKTQHSYQEDMKKLEFVIPKLKLDSIVYTTGSWIEHF